MRICLAGSGGGHVRQLLDLESVWSCHDHFFVTEDTALGQSIGGRARTYYVPHVALGQARLGRPIRMAWLGVLSCWRSFRIIMKERPDVVITTGAGSVYFATLFGRLTGARIVMIDSFARFDHPSAFARIAAPIAHCRIAQSPALAQAFRKTRVFDPLRIIDKPRAPKEAMMFVTVGATLPFDRMIAMVAQAKRDGLIPERVVAQIGKGARMPDGLEEVVETLSFDDMHGMLDRADIVVCHGGTGSLITALQHGCRVIVVPRLFELAEHYDDHQSEITSAFRQRGLVQEARDAQGFADALIAARGQVPLHATSEPKALRKFLTRALPLMVSSRKRRGKSMSRASAAA
ncbi:beta-1,4-glucuronosyltransferase WelK [Sphingobium sp.]|uniref:beta-1,4-glucuronosyltransferase WelK n=1 Tax=Sphingobium sp. TaxID=1912891 RepID=UPI003B3AC753